MAITYGPSNTLQFWIQFNNGAERLRLPVNPEMFQISYGMGYEDIQVNKLGEYTVIGSPQAVSFSFSSFFPRDYDSSYCGYTDIPAPWDAVEKIRHWMATGKPCRLIITGTPINYAVTIRKFDPSEKAGSVGDVDYSLEFKEYRFITPQTIDTSKPTVKSSSGTRPSTEKNTSGKTYIVKSGDSLYKIAQKQMGSGSDWNKLYTKNKAVIGPNPNNLKPGMKLIIP